MKVRLGRRDDYAVRAVLHLARHGQGGLCTKREIAEGMAIPDAFLPQILAELVTAGIVRSRLGRGGGYALARPGEQVSLLDVIEAVDGEIGVDACVLRGGPCRWEDQCAVHRFWVDAEQAFRDRLAASTFADIAAVDALLEGRVADTTPGAPAAAAP